MRLVLLSLILLAFPAAGEIYSYVDEQGNRVFTDRPAQTGSEAQRIELKPANSMPSAEPPAQKAPQKTKALGYRWLRIQSPEPDATLRDGAGDLTVIAESEPALYPGHSYRLLLDGRPSGQADSSPVFSLTNLDRGTHRLAVEIIDADGRSLERTPEQAIHYKRPSLIQKRLARPCQKNDFGVRPECPLRDKPAEKRDIPFLPFI